MAHASQPSSMELGFSSRACQMPDVPKINGNPHFIPRYADNAAGRQGGKTGAVGAFGLRKFRRWLGLNDDARLAQW
jgi:hypothetical protein